MTKRRTARAVRRLPAVATVRAGTIASIPEVLACLGADPAEVLAEAGIDLSLFDDPDHRISFAARSRLVQHCANRTDCRHFGLLVGQRGGLQSLGLVGLLVKYESDVGAALRSLVRYLHLHGSGATVTLTVDDGMASLAFGISQSDSEAGDQVGDAALAILLNILRTLCGPDWQPVAVRFAHRRPPDILPFQRFFRAPLQFDEEHNALLFAGDWLHRPLAAADPELHRLLREQIDALEAKYGEDLPSQVRGMLGTSLLLGRCTADRVGTLLSMHVRTLHRRLRAHGTSFRALAGEARHELARQLLCDTALNVSEVAAALDYADPRAFRRAFRRWTGNTPTRWRRQQRTS